MSDDTSSPFESRLADFREHVRARDITWLRSQRAGGVLSWLIPHLGESGYRDLGVAIDAGDIDLIDRQIAVMGDSTSLVDPPLIPVVPVTHAIGDPLTNDLDDPTLLVSRHGAVLPASAVRRERNTLVVVGILLAVAAAAIVAFLLLRSNDNKSNTTVLTLETTLATETIPVDTTLPVETTPSSALVTAVETVPVSSAVPNSVPIAASGTVPAAPSSPQSTVRPAALPAPAPLADAITTAQRSATFGPYLTMIEAAGLTDKLRAMKNVTILAPTESAFTRLAPDVQVALRSPANRVVLERIVLYSVLSQTRTSTQLASGNYATAEGTPVAVQTLNGTIRINDATITGPDVKVANGMFHAIDRLLIPPNVDLNTIVAQSGSPKTPPTTAPTPTTSTSPPTTTAPVSSAPTTAQPTTAPPTTAPPTTAPPTTAPPTTAPTTTRPPTTAPTTTRPPSTTIA